MINRYENRVIMNNNLEQYTELLNKKLLKNIKQYETAKYVVDYKSIINNTYIIERIWSVGDKYYKLSSEYYGDPKDWWVIALYNSKPTEHHVKIGDRIKIPTPLNKVLNYITF